MEIHFDESRGKAIGSKIRLAGKVFGLRMSVEEIVTERVVPYRKTWATIGSPRLLVIGHYRMGFDLSSIESGTRVRVFIDYSLPEKNLPRFLGLIFAPLYAKWCARRMIKDTLRHFGSRSLVAGVKTKPGRPT